MPKLKTHHWAGVTLSLKNCSGASRPLLRLAQERLPLCAASRQKTSTSRLTSGRPLAIVDGIVGMEGDGPLRATSVSSGMVVVSKDLRRGRRNGRAC